MTAQAHATRSCVSLLCAHLYNSLWASHHSYRAQANETRSKWPTIILDSTNGKREEHLVRYLLMFVAILTILYLESKMSFKMSASLLDTIEHLYILNKNTLSKLLEFLLIK